MLDGVEPPQAGEPRVTIALDLELLKADDVIVTDAVLLELRSADRLPTLITAVQRVWTEAFTLQLQRENYPAAQYLLEMQAAGILADDALGEDARARYTTALERSRAEMVAERNTVDADLRRARRSNVVTEEADGELTALLASADPTWWQPRPRPSHARQDQQPAALLPRAGRAAPARPAHRAGHRRRGAGPASATRSRRATCSLPRSCCTSRTSAAL